MNIKIVKVGFLETNCYLLKKDNNVLIIDPGDDFELIKSNVDGNVVGVIITHSHFDHVGALMEVKDYYDVPVYDMNNLKEGNNSIFNFNFDVIYTPGHLYDLITIYFKEEKLMFVGDFIFNGSIGRWDMDGADTNSMINSINKILKYDDDIVVYPGHGNKTTIGNERDNLKFYLTIL